MTHNKFIAIYLTSRLSHTTHHITQKSHFKTQNKRPNPEKMFEKKEMKNRSRTKIDVILILLFGPQEVILSVHYVFDKKGSCHCQISMDEEPQKYEQTYAVIEAKHTIHTNRGVGGIQFLCIERGKKRSEANLSKFW